MGLTKFSILRPTQFQRAEKFITAGLLLCIPSDKALEMKDEFDENRNGMLGYEEIRKLIVALDEKYLEKVKLVQARVEEMEESAMMKRNTSHPNSMNGKSPKSRGKDGKTQRIDMSGRFDTEDEDV